MRITLSTIILCLTFLKTEGQDQLIFKSGLIPGNDTVWIFKPTKIVSNKEYPAVYILHGWSGNYRSWNKLINLQEYADKYDCIIISPDGFYDLYYLDSPLIPNCQYASFFVKELYPALLNQYPIDTINIFITGLSMGGTGAMYLFLKNPHLFKSAGSTSGVLDLSYSGNKKKKLSELLGSYDSHKKIFDEHSAINLLKNIKNSNKHILFDCGTEDYLYESNNSFRKECDKLGIKATYISQPGAHEAKYWKKSIKYHFEFFNDLINCSE